MNDEPLVSVITPSYNSANYIEECVESVLSQTYQNWEMVIIDDLSTDDSIHVIEKFCERDSRIRLIRQEINTGPAKARNLGIEAAKGDFIAFLDSDDIWLPHKLEKQISFMLQNDLTLTYSSYYTIDENGLEMGIRKIKKEICYIDMLKSNHIGNLTGVYNCKKVGKFYMEDTGHEDYTLWIKIMQNVKFTRGLDEVLAKYRISRCSLSANKLKVLTWQWAIYRGVLGFNLLKSLYYFCWYVIYAFKKRIDL
jgi:glycosyltransferase involved in cell wall biosynthesis